jgi:hypothetical protein
MSVAFIPYRHPRKHFCQLGQMSFDDVCWPLNDRPDGRVLRDLSAQDHVLLIASSRMLTMRTGELRCQLSVLMCEPPAIQQRFYNAARLIASKFKYVLTHNTDLLCRLPNARFVAHGGSMLEVAEQQVVEKVKRISLIASDKSSTRGQRLRHEIVKWAAENAPDLDALGRGYQPLADKAEGHSPYFFSVVIENSQEPGYFTEKLIDSFLCRSLPIYWGAPDIEHFFDSRGMIRCTTAKELRRAIQQVTAADYVMREAFLEKNRTLAMQYLDQFGRAARYLRDSNGGLLAATNSSGDFCNLGAA